MCGENAFLQFMKTKMHRREFCTLMATGTGLAAFFPPGFDLGWMRINGEAIYGTRPRKEFGEGAHAANGGAFASQSTGELDAPDIRFTRNQRGDVVYAIVLGWPEGNMVIKSLGAASAVRPGKVENVEMFGYEQKLAWTRSAESLTVKKPASEPCVAIAHKV
jgi:alpha-L-fucosidase